MTIKSTPSDLIGLLASRPVLEGHVRRRLTALSNVRVIESCAVQSLITDDAGTAIKDVRVKVGKGYTTRVYRRRPTDLNGKRAVVIAGSEPNWRNGVICHAPDDDRMFAAYVGSLPTSEIYDIVAHAEPLSDFVRYRYPANLRRRYERLA